MVLYHWRVHENSTSAGHGAKSYAGDAGFRAVISSISRRGESAEIRTVPNYQGRYEVRYVIDKTPLISILIPTRDQPEVLDRCLTTLFDKVCTGILKSFQIDNGSRKADSFAVFKKWSEREPDRYRVLRHDVPFNFSEINNYGAEHANGEYLLFLNDDVEIISGDWLESMLGQASRPSIGAVGARLLYPDGSIQHAGIVLGIGKDRIAGHSRRHYPGTTAGYFGNVNTITNFSAVTGACLMCSKSDFDRAGGFDEHLAIAFNDVDLCLKLKSLGLNNVYLPHVELYHHESKSRGYEDSPEKRLRCEKEADILREKWSVLLDNDPCYNPNLTRGDERFSYRIQDRTN